MKDNADGNIYRIDSKEVTADKGFLDKETNLIRSFEHDGVHTKEFNFDPKYGNGTYQYYYFDGLYIGVIDVHLIDDLCIKGRNKEDILELSFLIEGEQIIKLSDRTTDVIFESQESYLVYLQDIVGDFCYHKNKPIKEIRIRMDEKFMKKHKLKENTYLTNRYALQHLQKEFIKPYCSKTQDILTELLSENYNGLSKRLFLESKVLELLALKMDNATTRREELFRTDHMVKKIYEVESIIASDLTAQFSIIQLSRITGINDFALKKEFKRIFGKTIFEYTTDLRMDKAKKLLKHSTKPIYEISEIVGYKNSTHFTAAFKKKMNLTPKAYRKSFAHQPQFD
ncbi:helix-turn-helix domain-containing protein [Aquimarina rhabdastrellae]